MTLFIDTSIAEEIRLGLFDNNKTVASGEKKIGYHYSEFLLTEIDALLKKVSLNLSELKSIVIVKGPGRFSALRTGVATANTLAWSLGIPIIGIGHIEQDHYWENVTSILSEQNHNTQNFIHALTPEYGQEPSISQPK